mgnify:CR=1 FL=1
MKISTELSINKEELEDIYSKLIVLTGKVNNIL